MKKLLPLILISLIFTTSAFSQAITPFTTCPDVSIAVVRAGTTANVTNPYYIYTVNTLTGSMTLLPGGPLVTTSPALNIQINGVGLNKTDGFLYGLSFDGTVNTARLVRFDKNYGITSFPNLAPPSSYTGLNGYINATAGDCDRSNNYYYSAYTANPGAVPGSLVLDKLFLGKIPNISTLPGGTPTAEYYEIDYSDMPCSQFVNSILNNPGNSGFKDFVFSPFTNTFFTYLTYKPAGATNFSGQMAEIKPIAGSTPVKYKMFCTPIVNTHTSEVQGTLIDKNGNFEVLFTDGSMWKISTSGSLYNYTGNIFVLNSATGLPNPSTGDLASCGGPVSGPLSVRLTSFEAVQKNCKTTFILTVENEINFSHYQLEQSFDGISFSYISKISANNYSNSVYHFSCVAPGKPAYYRLKAIDKDGNYTFSKTISVANTCDNNAEGLMINPNPATDIINVNWYGIKVNSVVELTIYNGVGKALQKLTKSISAGSSSFSLAVNNLPAGIYFIKAGDVKNATRFQAKFIKQ